LTRVTTSAGCCELSGVDGLNRPAAFTVGTRNNDTYSEHRRRTNFVIARLPRPVEKLDRVLSYGCVVEARSVPQLWIRSRAEPLSRAEAYRRLTTLCAELLKMSFLFH